MAMISAYNIDSGHEISALIIILPKNPVRKFSDEFSKYLFSKGASFQSAFFNVDEFSLGLVFIEPRFIINRLPVDLS